mmetsp:Transcript_7463/g.23860  ORF Transcript_7463/g.23860 Transcript_7463/m.23860 type:complete len:285 (-) Transcript_7463:56-910(-)
MGARRDFQGARRTTATPATGGLRRFVTQRGTPTSGAGEVRASRAVPVLDLSESRRGDEHLFGLEDVARVDVVERGQGEVGDVASREVGVFMPVLGEDEGRLAPVGVHVDALEEGLHVLCLGRCKVRVQVLYDRHLSDGGHEGGGDGEPLLLLVHLERVPRLAHPPRTKRHTAADEKRRAGRAAARAPSPLLLVGLPPAAPHLHARLGLGGPETHVGLLRHNLAVHQIRARLGHAKLHRLLARRRAVKLGDRHSGHRRSAAASKRGSTRRTRERLRAREERSKQD